MQIAPLPTQVLSTKRSMSRV